MLEGGVFMSINGRIRELRKELKLTQAVFGSKIGIAQGHLTGLESGNKRVTEKTLKVICSVYGVAEKWMRDGTGEMFYKAPTVKVERLTYLFCELIPDFQNYVLQQIEILLELQYKQENAGKGKKKKRKPYESKAS